MRGHHNPNGNLQKVNKMPKAQGIWGPIGNIALKLANFGSIRENSVPVRARFDLIRAHESPAITQNH